MYDESQPDPTGVAMRFTIARAEDDVRAIEVLLLLLPEGVAETPAELMEAVKALPEESWAEENQLKVDPKDERGRYTAFVPYGMRYAFALRFASTKELVISGIYDPIEAPEPTPTPGPTATPEPMETPEPGEWEEFEEPEVPPQVPSVNQAPYVAPKDEDMDGLYTRTEYRLGLNPQRRDSRADGYWDGLRLYLGAALVPDAAANTLTGPTPEPALTSTPRETPEPTATPRPTQTPEPSPTPEPEAQATAVLTAAPDEQALLLGVQAGLLSTPVGEPDAAAAASDMQRRWQTAGTSNVAHLDHGKLRMVLVNNRGVLVGTLGTDEQLKVEGALTLATLGLSGKNYEQVRSLDVSRDGNLALLYDRRERGAELTDDARVIDLRTMKSYRIPGTKDALHIAFSPDGRYVAYATQELVARIDLSTGERFVDADRARMERVEMLAFTAEDALVTRVTSMGMTALLPDGEWTLLAPQWPLTKCRDVEGLTVYDADLIELDIDMQVYYRATGLIVRGEDGKDVRNFSPSYFLRSLLGKEIEGLEDFPPKT